MLGEAGEPPLLRHSQCISQISILSRFGLSKYNYRSTTHVAAPSLRVSPPPAGASYVEFLRELQFAIC